MGSIKTTVVVLAAAGLLAGCGDDSSSGGKSSRRAAPATATIPIRGFKFVPAVVTVKAGARVTFVNRDRADHTATGGAFDTGTLHSGDSKTLELRRPGILAYRCDFHPFMTAQVTVVK